MAYTDINQGQFRPKGLAISALINGGGLAAALIFGTTAGNLLVDPITKIINIPVEVEPVEVPNTPDTPTKVEKKKQDDLPVTNSLHRAPTGNEITATDDTDSTGLGEGGGTSEIEIPPPPPIDPPVHNPILKIAKPDPRFAAFLQPEYPMSEIRAENEGSVTVSVLVGPDGRVKDVKVISAASPAFAEATRKQALKKWRFLPATRDGDPYESWREMTVRFEMPD